MEVLYTDFSKFGSNSSAKQQASLSFHFKVFTNSIKGTDEIQSFFDFFKIFKFSIVIGLTETHIQIFKDLTHQRTYFRLSSTYTELVITDIFVFFHKHKERFSSKRKKRKDDAQRKNFKNLGRKERREQNEHDKESNQNIK